MSAVEYARYGLGTTDILEVQPVRLRKPAKCSGCGRTLEPGEPIFRWVKEVYATGSPYCPACAVAHPTVGIFARVEVGEDRGRRQGVDGI